MTDSLRCGAEGGYNVSQKSRRFRGRGNWTMGDSPTSNLTIRLFGAFTVQIAGEPVARLHIRSADRLLALLAANAPRPMTSSAVLEALWSDEHSRSTLHHAVGHLRSALGAHGTCVQTARGCLSIDLAQVDLDLVEFDRALRSGEPTDVERADRIAGQELLAGWDDLWVLPHREQARDRLVRALKLGAEMAIAAGDTATAIRMLRRYLRRSPAEEPGWLKLMELYVCAGDRLAAIDLFTRYSRQLRKVKGMEPSDKMTELYNEIVKRRSDAAADALAVVHEPVGGAVPLGSSCYVERPCDAALRSALERGEGIIVLRGPRQTGKSSLLARGLQQALESGSRVIVTDFGTLTAADMASLEALCRWLALTTATQIGADDYTADEWRPFLAPVANLERYVLRRLLADVPTPCVWAMDDVDRLFGLPFAQDFFSILRSWHGRRSFSLTDPWRRLTLIVVCATEAHLYIADLNRSPFNVGERIDVGDFSPEQVADLNARCGAVLTAQDLGRLRQQVDGHPYLVRRSLHELRNPNVTVDSLMADALADGGPYADHLRRLRRHVEADEELLDGVHQVLDGLPCSEECFFRLRSAGLISGSAPDDARLRCGLYADYFRRHLR